MQPRVLRGSPIRHARVRTYAEPIDLHSSDLIIFNYRDSNAPARRNYLVSEETASFRTTIHDTRVRLTANYCAIEYPSSYRKGVTALPIMTGITEHRRHLARRRLLHVCTSVCPRRFAGDGARFGMTNGMSARAARIITLPFLSRRRSRRLRRSHRIRVVRATPCTVAVG